MPDRPNILMFLTDRQSLDAIGCYGASVCRTPNIDRLASQGMRFPRPLHRVPAVLTGVRLMNCTTCGATRERRATVSGTPGTPRTSTGCANGCTSTW